MTTLASLKLVSAKRQSKLPATHQRRVRLLSKISEQILLAQTKDEGKSVSTFIKRSIRDPQTGSQKIIEIEKSVKPWWFTAETGQVCLHVKYGSKVVELAKGKSAVELASLSELVPTLTVLKRAVESGELDAQLELASKSLRAGFKKKS